MRAAILIGCFVLILLFGGSVSTQGAGAAGGGAGPTAPAPRFDGTWTDMAPAEAPSPRVNFPLVYDASADRAILFGGWDGTDDGTDETWAYDFETNGWTNLNPATHPPSGWVHGAAYDAHAQRTILFGGFDGTTFTNETWSFDFANNTWENLEPAVAPSLRSRQGMAYDAESDRVILFGGLAEEGYSDETWAYDSQANTWTRLAPAVRPPARRSMGFAYDSNADRIVLFGGVDVAEDRTFNDTWTFDFDTVTWTNQSPPTAPSARYAPGFAFNPFLDRFLLFAGGTPGSNSETWAYGLDDNAWELVATDPAPSRRIFLGMTFDVDSDRALVFGGQGASGLLGDTWSLDIPHPTPSAPRGLSATAGNGRVDLAWQPPLDAGDSPITGYTVYRGPDANELLAVATLGEVLAYSDQNVSNGEPYVYAVSAVNAQGEGPRSARASTIPDGEPPTTTATLSGSLGEGGWFTSPVEVTLTATDDASGVANTTYRVDNGPWNPYVGPSRLAVDGRHAVDFRSIDAVGNEESMQTVGVWMDATSPAVQSILDGTAAGAYWYRTIVVVSFIASDETSGLQSIRYRLDGTPWTDFTTPFPVADGRHVLEYVAIDVAGLSGESIRLEFGVDTEGPASALRVTGPEGANGWYLGPVLVSVEGSDATSGVDAVDYQIDDGAWGRYEAPFPIGAGVHTIRFAATDAAGIREVVNTALVRVDDAPPRVADLRPSGHLTAGRILFSWSGSDLESGIVGYEIRSDGGPWTEVGETSAFELSLPDGPHRVSVRARDGAGQETEIFVDVVIDTGVFSLGGPYGASPTLGVVGTAIVVSAILLWWRRRRA